MQYFRVLAIILALTVPSSAQLTQTGAGIVAGGGFIPATPCSGTGLDFSIACNSQYIGIL